MYLLTHEPPKHEPWNKGKITGQKPPLKLQEIWAIRFRLQLDKRIRDLALFNLAIDSKLRACDLVSLRWGDVFRGQRIVARTTVMQQKTHRPVQFEITQQARESLLAWIKHKDLRTNGFLFPSRYRTLPHISTRQYHRLVTSWVCVANCCSSCYGELMNPSAVSLPTEFIQLDWEFGHDASDFCRRITTK